MTPLTRLVTMGSVAAFNTKRPSTAHALHSRPWPGGRRLSSAEDRSLMLSGDGTSNELDEWPGQEHIQATHVAVNFQRDSVILKS